ncbi:MAG: histidine kinase [Deltaproteobacteria bacterium HGW-Deltaproteobacteria-6]|jgi:CBS domain-containing protein|nr:MAG: histidine kinase [Deltaproteobacteria bacterium HGW-Deltaproteobacteria-6]
MLTVRDLLSRKGSETFSIQPDKTIYEALQMMAAHNVGALLVIKSKKLLGIISERDYARKLVLKGKNSRDTLVRDVMVRQLTSVTPDVKVEDCMKFMTDQHIRHLPVLENDKLAGIISIGDVVKGMIDQQKTTINHLERYISGGYLEQDTLQ